MAFDGIKKALFDDGDKRDSSVEDNFYTVSNKQLKEDGKNGS